MPEDPRPPRPSTPARPWVFGVAVVVLACVHLALVRYYFGSALGAEVQFSRGDFATHAEQVHRVLEAWASAGQHWAYDVQLLAGAPNGVLFDADNKGWELWTWALIRLGVSEAKAFNGFVLFVHLVLPVVIYASARLLRFDRSTALTAVGLALLIWGFDSFLRWLWFVGTMSYLFVAYFALLPLALFHRWIEDRKPKFALACAVALALAHLVHPYVFFILVGPMLAEYIRAGFVERSLSPAQHGLTWAIAALTLVVNGWWLRTALRFFHYILDSAYYEQSGLVFAFYDALALLRDVDTQGWIGPHTGFRLLAFVATLGALRAWRREGDRRWLPFLVLIVVLAAFAYLGGYTPVAQLQPYRHAAPLAFALVIPGAWWLVDMVRSRPWASAGTGTRATMLVLSLFAVQYLLRDVLYFFADALPRTQMVDGKRVDFGILGYGYIPSYRYDDLHDWEKIVAWVAKYDDGQSRWLVADQVFGEYLMARTEAQVVGGFRVRNIEHSDANWFRHQGLAPPYDPEQFERYLQTYGIRWVIINAAGVSPWWEAHSELFARVGLADGMLVYRYKGPISLVDGHAQVEARLNRIDVRGAKRDEDLVLRFHWMEALICTPDCEIVREPVDGDRVGFIRIPAPHPAEFRVENSYVFPD